MQISAQANRLNQQSLLAFKTIFTQLPPPTQTHGAFAAEFIGPPWFRWVAPRGLIPLGLSGWCGKEIGADGKGFNLLRRGGVLKRRFPIEIALAPSSVDGKPCLAVTYPPVNPWPWPTVVDELRQLDSGTLLGLTFFRIGPLARLPLPFLLHEGQP